MREGRTAEQKEKLIAELTKAVCEAVGVSERAVSVIINDIPDNNWGSGGVSFTQRFGSKT